MLRRKIITTVKAYGGSLCPFLLLLGVAIFLYFPNMKQQGSYVDENAIGQRGQHVEILVDTDPFLSSAAYEWPSRLVRGQRSPGTEVIAIYVNTEHNASIQLANIVTASLRKYNNLGCDVQFYFVNNDEEWPIPQSYARAALVLNISTFKNDHMCLDMYGKHGLQPNRDLVHTILSHAQSTDQDVSLLCQTNRSYATDRLSPLQYVLASLLEAIRLPLYPQRWHEIPTRGIGTVAFSSNPQYATVAATERTRSSNSAGAALSSPQDKYAMLLLQTIFSLNGLEERFHHANNVYMPTSQSSSAPYEVGQFALFGFMTAAVSSGYAYYQLEGFNFNLAVAAGLGLTTPVAAQVHQQFGWPGFVIVSVVFAALFAPATWNTTWMSVFVAALAMLESLQPATGLLCSAEMAISALFLHPAVAYFPGYLFIGTVIMWLIWGFFIFYIDLPIWSTAGISLWVTSLFIYPNTLWVSSRFIRSIFLRKSLQQDPARAGDRPVEARKKKQ